MKIIRSSDIANYLFCPVSWWLGITKGVKVTKLMLKGEKHHKLVSEKHQTAMFLYSLIIIVIFMIIALILYWFLR